MADLQLHDICVYFGVFVHVCICLFACLCAPRLCAWFCFQHLLDVFWLTDKYVMSAAKSQQKKRYL
jgi:hypothetical protein